MRLAGVASRDVVVRRRFLMAPVPWVIGLDDGFFRREEDAGRIGEAERDEVGEADSGEETLTVPFLVTESDSIYSVAESSIASPGGDCGRFGGAVVAVEAIEAVSDGLLLRTVGSLLVAVVATGTTLDGVALGAVNDIGTVSDDVALGAVGAFSVVVDAIGAVADGAALGAVGTFSVVTDAAGTMSDGVALKAVGGLSVVTDATGTVSDGVVFKAVGAFSVGVDAIGVLLDGSFFEAVGAFLAIVDASRASLETLALGAVGAFLVALDCFGAPLGSLTLRALGAFLVAVVALGASLDGVALRVNAFLVAVEASGAALDGMGLALEGNFVDESSPRELGSEPADVGDETISSASSLYIVIVALFSLGSLEDPGETGPSVAPLKIADGSAADAALIGDFSEPTGDAI